MTKMKMTESKEAPEAISNDDDAVMDQVCKELMQAFESKDKDKLLESFHYLVADLMRKLSSSDQD